MPIYQAPVDDWLFILNDFLRMQDRHDLPGHAALGREFCAEVVRAAARFHEEVMFPVGMAGDAEGARLVDGRVRTPTGYLEAWQAYREAGWLGIGLPEEIGGAGLPGILAAVVGEMRITTAHSLAMYGSFCPAAARMLAALGDGWMREHLVPRLVVGDWTATMCLTESHCGTDLRQIRTRAVPQADGTWRLQGTKIFISGGDHDLTDNIVHIVLAKVPDASGAVANDLSAVNVFVVPRRLVDPATGALGEANRVSVGAIEHKMGIEGSATCVLDFDGAVGWRVAGPGAGGTAANMAPMFLLMNHARVSTALSGVGYAELAAQNATAYARERLSGRAPQGARRPELPADPIVVHPDIRRQLLGARSFAEGARATALRAALWHAEAESGADEAARQAAGDLVELLTPVMKAYFTDEGFAAADACLQVLGGHGYIRDHGLEQMVRNARIARLYEGANGIQAVDLVQRKLPAKGWRAGRAWVERIVAFADRAGTSAGPLATAAREVGRMFELLRERAASAPASNLAVAYDVLQAVGIVTVAWTWAEVLAVLDGQGAQIAAPLQRRKRALAAFWMERQLPLVAALCRRIEAGGEPMLILADDEV